MSRLKFRAWYIPSKSFLDESDNTSNFLQVVPCDTTGIFSPMYMTIEAPNIKLQQYTGLKDKNGVEIYEGDIVEDNANRYKVIYHMDGFYLHSTYSPDDMLLQLRHSNGLNEVIGNIYENPELINNIEKGK